MRKRHVIKGKINPLGPFKIRERTLRGYSREAQGYTAWDEAQIVQGRTIVSRHDTREQAERALKKLLEP